MSKTTPKIDPMEDARAKVLGAALPNVVFDGWTDTLLEQAILDKKIDRTIAMQAFPRGVIDLLVYYHQAGDADISEVTFGEGMKIRDKITALVKARIERMEAEKEPLRKALSFWAIPGRHLEGGELVWATVDAMWNAIGDSSEDLNWYTKRATLAGVYSSTLLYWLSDDSADHTESWAFLDRRISDVMQFETFKAKVKNSPLGGLYDSVFSAIRKPTPN